jgi:beta-carotene 3-hydroxylase
MIVNTAIVLATIIGMEVFAYLVHRYVMHGRFGWRLHKDHHEPSDGWLERNDLYAVFLAAIVMSFFIAGTTIWPLAPIAIGMTLYGLIYFIVHDGLVHKRWPFRHIPRRGYLRRLYQAHKLHHATKGRTGAVSFGFLYAPPVRKLLEQGSKQRSNSSSP